MRWIILFLLLLLLFPLLYIEMPFPQQRTAYRSIPNNITREITETVSQTEEICSERQYRYSTLGENVDYIGVYVQPQLQISNLEERWGLFQVNFSYVDEEEFAFEEYGGEHLQDTLDAGIIGEEEIVFHSDTYEFYLGPGESVIVDERTRMPEEGKYWAIAEILTPNITECKTTISYMNVTRNRTFTENERQRYTRIVQEYTSLKDKTGITFGQWFIICLLLVLIAVLLHRIYVLRSPDRMSENQ